LNRELTGLRGFCSKTGLPSRRFERFWNNVRFSLPPLSASARQPSICAALRAKAFNWLAES
jgi:hypothetical protein